MSIFFLFPAHRTAITIPEKSWGKFRDVFDDYVDKMKEATEAEAENTEKAIAQNNVNLNLD